MQWFRPNTLAQLLSIKSKYLDKATIIVGNSEIGNCIIKLVVGIYFIVCTGIEVKFKNAHFTVLVSPAQIPEMNVLEETNDGLLIGAACTLSDIEVKLKEICDRLPQHKTRALKAILEMLRFFASTQIRNVAVS